VPIFIGVGLNYKTHAEETKVGAPSEARREELTLGKDTVTAVSNPVQQTGW
jgi:hypothetical protein